MDGNRITKKNKKNSDQRRSCKNVANYGFNNLRKGKNEENPKETAFSRSSMKNVVRESSEDVHLLLHKQ